jgi:hypothetical protein
VKDKIELNSMPSEDKRPRRSQMAMNNDLTREQFKAREIETPEPTTAEVMAENAKAMATLQEQYRAMTVKGRQKQRNRLREKLGMDTKPLPPRVRIAPMPARVSRDEIVEDKLYTVGKRDKTQ